MFLGDVVLFRFPLHAKGRIRQHVVKTLVRVAVAVNEAVFGFAGAQGVAKGDVLDVLTFDHEVGAADGVGLGVVLLAEKLQVGTGVQAFIRVNNEFF